MLNHHLQLLVIILSLSWGITSSLKILMLDVPSPTVVGESVEMSCSYDMESDVLYSVKWYKNNVEFYRYLPKDWPPGQFLPVPGIKLDLSRSNKRSIFLRHVDIQSEGVYRCEVSSEAPHFSTAEIEKEMKVYVLPTEGPRIHSNKSHHKIGDVVAVNCTSSKSKPGATLRWYINDMPVDPTKGDYYTFATSKKDRNGLETSTLSLRFVLTDQHMKNGMRLKCTASIARMSKLSSETHFDKNHAHENDHHPDDEKHQSIEKKKKSTQSENLSQIKSGSCSIIMSSSLGNNHAVWILLWILSLIICNISSSSSADVMQ